MQLMQTFVPPVRIEPTALASQPAVARHARLRVHAFLSIITDNTHK